jgi:hypothetical protein
MSRTPHGFNVGVPAATLMPHVIKWLDDYHDLDPELGMLHLDDACIAMFGRVSTSAKVRIRPLLARIYRHKRDCISV